MHFANDPSTDFAALREALKENGPREIDIPRLAPVSRERLFRDRPELSEMSAEQLRQLGIDIAR